MQRTGALVGSIAIHVVAGIVLFALRSQEVEVGRQSTSEPIQLVERDPMLVEIVELANTGGGGSFGAGDRVARAEKMGSDPISSRVEKTGSDPISRVRHSDKKGSDPITLADSLAHVATESVDSSSGNGRQDGDGGQGGDGGDGGGQGGGHGAGRGRGIGLGDGAVIAEQPRVATPAAPRASKARPAKLIYPSADREVEDGKVFIARVTVDREGFVVGARLLQRMGGPKDDQAGSLIFRFRYAPALDDEGRPIRSTLDQQFLVGD